jgi:hypothetical protein
MFIAGIQVLVTGGLAVIAHESLTILSGAFIHPRYCKHPEFSSE